MSKKNILLAIILVLIIAVLIVIVSITSAEKSNNQVIEGSFTNIAEDNFVCTVISNTYKFVTVIPNEDELIRKSSFNIIDVEINDKTLVYNEKEEIMDIKDINLKDEIKITFNGKIYDVKPGRIIAERIDVIKSNIIEDIEE